MRFDVKSFEGERVLKFIFWDKRKSGFDYVFFNNFLVSLFIIKMLIIYGLIILEFRLLNLEADDFVLLRLWFSVFIKKYLGVKYYVVI